MKNTKLIILGAAFFMLSGMSANTIANTQVASAASIAQNQQSKKVLSQSVINEIDGYISVKNNQFILSPVAKSNFNAQDISLVDKIIAGVNNEVIKDNNFIDPNTKEIIDRNGQYFNSFAAYNKNFTTKRFWWGKRYYFTSNIAVKRGAAYLRKVGNSRYNLSIFLGAIGDSVGYVYPGWAAFANLTGLTVSAAADQYFNAASGLIKYSRRHKHDQIYMDFNHFCQYSFHVLK